MADTAAPAALTGIGLLLPGGITSPEGLWRTLLEAACVVGPYPRERWAAMLRRLPEDKRPGRVWEAGTVDRSAPLDAAFFGFSPAEAAELDPVQRMLLEVSAGALADAGIAARSLRQNRRVGVFVASASVDAATARFAPHRASGLVDVAGGGAGMLTSPLMRWLDTRGPHAVVDTACSAGATALHMARLHLAAGLVDLALVAAVNSVDNPQVTLAFEESGVLAADGRCKPFDAAADGYVRSEGAAAVVLENPARARRRRSRSYARVLTTAAGADGRSPGGLGSPNGHAQLDVMSSCWQDLEGPGGERAGAGPARVGYVEAHGTGTVAGDTAELRALNRLFRRPAGDEAVVGSHKGALGHLEGAAGLVGVIVAALGLYHGRIPPTTGHATPLRAARRWGLRVPTGPEPWPEHRPFAQVNAWGFGGSLVVAALERGDRRDRAAPLPPPEADGAELDREGPGPTVVPISGTSRGSVAEAAGRAAAALEKGVALSRLAETAAARRDHHGIRAAVAARTRAEAARALRALAEGRPHERAVGPRAALSHGSGRRPRVVLVFPGQGTQAEGMGDRLAEVSPAYAGARAAARQALAGVGAPRQDGPGGIAATQQAIFAHQAGLLGALAERFSPDAVIGHSLGELAAAYAAGALSLEKAARIVVERSRVLESASALGGLVAAELGPAEAAGAAREAGAELAAVNGPNASVLSGSHEALARLSSALEKRGVRCREVPQGPPAHSSLLDDRLAAFSAAIGEISARSSGVQIYSTAGRARPIRGADLGSGYWVRQLRDPVDLRTAVAAAAAEGPSLFIEVGARSVLAAPLLETLSEAGLEGAVASARGDHPAGEAIGLALQVAACYVHGPTPRPWDDEPVLPPADLGPPSFTRSRPAPLDAGGLDEQVRAEAADHIGRPLRPGEEELPLEELGLGSIHLLQLRARLIGHFGVSASRLPPHPPTVAGITAALADVLGPRGGSGEAVKAGEA